MNAFTLEEVHKNLIGVGDIIIHHGKDRTVCKKDITRCDFFGIKLFGDSYVLGYQKVKRLKLNNHHLRIKNETN
ncbi:MAG: hypothetical protein WCX83_00310 [Candidatus Cloacimonas sp.]